MLIYCRRHNLNPLPLPVILQLFKWSICNSHAVHMDCLKGSQMKNVDKQSPRSATADTRLPKTREKGSRKLFLTACPQTRLGEDNPSPQHHEGCSPLPPTMFFMQHKTVFSHPNPPFVRVTVRD